MKKAKDGRYVFNLYAPNHVIVATSQVYTTTQAAVNGIKSIITNAAKAPVEDQTLKNYTTLTYPKWELYVDKGGQFRFRLNAPNGSCIVHSQGYTSKSSCKNGIDSIIRCSINPEIDKSYLKKEQ
ncbi:MAG: YegP family protein [Clostridia bacterium]|nr:YegP family protein [Clostridia bacterium]